VLPKHVPVVAALVGGLVIGGAVVWSFGEHSAAVPEPRPPLVSASMQPSAGALDANAPPPAPRRPQPVELAPQAVVARPLPPPSPATGPRIELLGQDDLASGEMLLRLRIVGDEGWRKNPRKRRD
jgi:hypothetical protein